MKTDVWAKSKNKSRNPYTNKYKREGYSSSLLYDNSIHSAGLPYAVVGQSARVVHKINFCVLPLPGTVLMHDKQRYVMAGFDLYKRRDGQIVPIILWESHYPECGRPFQYWTCMRSEMLNRRCPNHRALGKVVTKAGDKRQEVAHD